MAPRANNPQRRHHHHHHHHHRGSSASSRGRGFVSRQPPALSLLESQALLVLRRYAWPSLFVFLASLLASYFYFGPRLLPRLQSSPISPRDDGGDFDIYGKALITHDVSYKSVLEEFSRSRLDKSKRHFNNSVLAYVTPWNSKGYDMAKLFRHKFTHVSPVWYQLKCGESLELHGRHDADLDWIESVRIRGHPMVLPRVALEGQQLDTVLIVEDDKKLAIKLISSECKKMGYDGIVLEVWNAWAASGILDNPILRQRALHFVRDLGAHLQRIELPRPNRHMRLIFVIPPPSNRADAKSFTASDMKMLGNAVDGFSLMTYDYSNMYRPGPNAPLPWLKACLQLLIGKKREDPLHKDNVDEQNLSFKVLTGLNFYGNDFLSPQGGGPIIGHEYISLLRKHKPTLLWDDKVKEHYFEYLERKKKHIVFYPSLQSVASRLEVASQWGTGISIWEIGQGLEYFFDLL